MVQGKYKIFGPLPYKGTTTPIRQTQKIRFVILGHVEGAERLILGHYLFNMQKTARGSIVVVVLLLCCFSGFLLANQH